MPGKVLLDTNIVIAFFSGEEAVSQHFADREVTVPSIVLGELYYGARKSARTAANLTRIDDFAAAVSVAGCDAVTAQHYGVIKDRLRLKGNPIPENDIWIAAVARQFGLALVSCHKDSLHMSPAGVVIPERSEESACPWKSNEQKQIPRAEKSARPSE